MIYYCIISHPQEHQVLLFNGEPCFYLPQFELEASDWFPYDVEKIRQYVHKNWGLDATVLRHIRQWEFRTLCELEIQDSSWIPPANTHWVSLEELVGISLENKIWHTLLEQWFAERKLGPPANRPPWEFKGWYAKAVDWIEIQLKLLGYHLVQPIEVVKSAWSCSAILRVPVLGKDLFFKAVHDKPPSEVALTSALAERWPNNVPRILATDFERRWMLMEDFGEKELDSLPDECAASAVELFARIQIEESDRLDRWEELGCPKHGLKELPALWEKMLADREFFMAEERALSPSEIERMKRFLPRWSQQCSRLAAYSIPETLHNQDFRYGNLRMVKDTFLFFDWSDTVISHPFFSLNRLLDDITPSKGVNAAWQVHFDHPDDGRRRAVRDAYLSVFTDFAPLEELSIAFEISRQLNRPYWLFRLYDTAHKSDPTNAGGMLAPIQTRHLFSQTLEWLNEF